MRDVAKAAGVSASTVSRVIGQSTSPISISDETTQRVLAAIEQLGYHPNMAARALRGQNTSMIAVMIADISNPMYHSIVRTVQAIARQRNYDVLIANTDHVYDNELHFCDAIMRRPVDGVLMVPYQLTNDDMQNLITRVDAPVVALSWPDYYDNIDTVYANDEAAIYQTTRWLIEQKGHQRIGFIGVTPAFRIGERRRLSFLRALRESGLPTHYLAQGDFSIDSGYRAIEALLEMPQRPSAVFACNDLMAIGAIVRAKEMGYRVPEDVAIVGFDNIPETTIVTPTLTTIEQKATDMGQLLAKALFERIEGEVEGPGRTYEIACRLIERQST